MSDVVEKTLTALPSLLSLDSQPGSAKLSTNSKLGSLIRGITELTSKHEEEKLIQRELSSIKEQVSSPNTTMRQMKELMVRTIYCEMLGYEATFSYIHAIKLAQQGNVLEKRVGYLAVSLFLNESHELLLLLVNTVLKDLQSTNLIEVCMALTVVSQMFPKDMIPAILPLVEEKLNHSKEIIRRKAVLALYKFYLIAPNQVQHIHNRFRKALCDKDPGVMSASLHIYLQLIQENPESYKDLTASFVTILKQVVAGKLPMDFNYHNCSVFQLWFFSFCLFKITLQLFCNLLQSAKALINLVHMCYCCFLKPFPINPLTYAPDNEWFVETMNTVFSVGGDTLQPDISNSFLKLLSEGFDDEEENKKLRLFAVNSYISLLQGEPSKLPQRFLQAICWVLGEYSHLREDVEPDLVLGLLVKLLDIKSTSSETKSWILMAMTKLCSGGAPLSVPLEVSETYSSSMDTMLRQRAQELQYLSQNAELQARVLPRGVSQEPVEVDSSLSFLDGFVSEALAAGAAPYKPPHQRQEELSRSKALSLEPYGLSLPISMSSCSIADRQSPTLLSVSSGLSGDRTDHSHRGGSATLKLDGVRRVWGKEGYLAQRESAEETAPVEAPSPLQPLVQQGDGDASYSQTPTPIPEYEQEKQQLASSLFVGLASQSSVCLMGKSEQTSQRFRRKLKDPAASFPSSTQNPLVSPPSSVDHLLLDSSISSDLISSPEQTHLSSVDLTVANGEVELPDRDMKGIKSTLLREDSALAAGSSPHKKLDRPKDSCLTSHLPAELSGLPHSEITPLCTSPSLDLSSCHVQKDNSLVLLIFVKSSSDYDIQQIQVQVTCEELEVSCVCDSPVEELKSHGVAVCQYSLTVKSPSVYFVLSGMMSHQIPDNSLQETQFSHRLPLTSFLRPLRLSTEEYGTMWLAFSHDTKQNLPLMMDAEEPLTATLKVLKDKLQLHVVEIIGNEGIVACCLRQDQPCLLHCRVQAGMLAVWLRSPIPELPDCLLYHCQRALQES
uniref:Adaptor-related protein complex 4, epsilon 1 subunit n=1 Tax=Nothobranchius pienaari TaxID=704102 RepID=A0A1A8MTX6_9TELE